MKTKYSLLKYQALSQDVRIPTTRKGPGAVFGDTGFMLGVHNTTVLAVTRVDALMLQRQDLNELLKQFPEMQQ